MLINLMLNSEYMLTSQANTSFPLFDHFAFTWDMAPEEPSLLPDLHASGLAQEINLRSIYEAVPMNLPVFTDKSEWRDLVS